MTAIVGILCEEGVVLGTDSSATFGAGGIRTIEQPYDKLHVIGGSVAVAGSGPVGMGQRFEAIVKEAWDKQLFKGSPLNIAKTLSKLALEDFRYTYAPNQQYSALVVFPFKRQFYLCEFTQADFQPELKTEDLWYCSLGSTMHITDSFLALLREILWRSGPPPLSEGVLSAIWTLDHAIAVNPGGVQGPVKIAQCTDADAKIELLQDLSEHRQYIKNLKDSLRSHCTELTHPPDQQVPDVPHPA